MFEEKATIEIITQETEIKVVGWGMKKCVELGLVAENDFLERKGF